jgi:hypothetical protein
MTQLGAQRPAVLPRSVEVRPARRMPTVGCHCLWGLTELQLSPGCEVEVEDGKAERAFMVDEWVVHDSVG